MIAVHHNFNAEGTMNEMKGDDISHSSRMDFSLRKSRCSREEMRTRIIETADELFHKFGFDRTPISDIAANLGMSSANIYKFFPSKRALIEACANVCLGQLREILLHAAHSRSNSIERIEAVVLSLYHFNRKQVTNDYEFYRLMLLIHREEWACIRDFRDLRLKVVTDVLEEGVRTGELALTDTFQTAKMILDCMAWITNPALFYELKGGDIESRLHAQMQFLSKTLK